MDLGLKELGITFMVGAFTILGLELILYHFFNKQLTGFFHGRLGLSGSTEQESRTTQPGGTNEDQDENELTMRAAVFIGLAFAVGVLAEDVSEKYRDGLHTPFSNVAEQVMPNSLIQGLDLPVKYDARMQTLFREIGGDRLVPKQLAEELARTKSFSLADPVNGEKVERWINTANRCIPTKLSYEWCPSLSELEQSASKLYYYAKNTTFAVENYYDEMKKIQIRLDFSRSIAMLAFVYFVAALLLVLILLTRVTFRFLISLIRDSVIIRPAIVGESYRKLLVKVPVILLGLFLVYFVAIWAYARESDEFNKRAFGYFSTMQITSELTSKKQAVEKGERD